MMTTTKKMLADCESADFHKDTSLAGILASHVKALIAENERLLELPAICPECGFFDLKCHECGHIQELPQQQLGET